MTNPKDQAEKNVIKEIANSLMRMDGEREHIKTMCDDMKENHESDPSELKRLAKILHKQNLEEEKAKANSIFERYEELFED